MTNGEKIKEIFPDAEISIVKSNYGRTKVAVEWKFEQIPSYYNLFYEDWWNAEYKEPTKHETKYCDRNICLKNEYNNVSCEDCEVTKSQEPTTKNNLGVDYVSRAELMSVLSDYYDTTIEYRSMLKEITALPPVTPQAIRKGRWMAVPTEDGRHEMTCSCCGYVVVELVRRRITEETALEYLKDRIDENKFCPNCGADMREVK